MRFALAFLLIGCFAAIGVWDVVATYRSSPLDTVSRTLLDWSRAFPVLPFGLGVICGHVFWPLIY